MARRAALVVLLLGLLGALSRGQDLDLLDALGEDDKKPTTPPKKPIPEDDLNLEDALGGGQDNEPAQPYPPKPKPDPNPHQPGSSGRFSDSDLADGTGGGGGGGSPRDDGNQQAESPGVIPGIVGAVVVAVAGAVSSFIAYQKKKFCFKENGEQGDVNMENHQGTNTEPPVQRTLLEKA
ncbi:CD99 antigen-like isoform 1-T1 [Trichechus inunguis]|uniref:CD99 antigen isoform X1 n=1 Tax=Trichechus manatus latirostris TaxID=127582 RepID=A0A2Y9RJ54_TRIMA|nr:CD99 antigen isoform X1 [Trichechus manatus latirostris]